MMDISPFHPDELAAQDLAGGGAGGAGIRDHMVVQHQDFFAGLSYLAVAVAGADGWPAATMLTGEPGFIQAVDPGALRIGLPSGLRDPTASTFAAGQEIGVLGLDLATRRRNRVNGTLARLDGSLTIAVRQSFGNCPKYIQRRTVEPMPRRPGLSEWLPALDDAARSLIHKADTVFVASRSRPDAGAQGGVDISHRGGQPGFVRIDGDSLVIPDFRGNRYYNTLGNMLGDPRAALLFVDFDSGDLLHLQGRVTIDWSQNAAREILGAERSWRFGIERIWRRPAALPLRWTFVDQADTTMQTGVWTH